LISRQHYLDLVKGQKQSNSHPKAIGYKATIMGSKDPIIWKIMRILLDSGCAATLINQNLVKTLKPQKKIELSGLQRLVTLVLTGNVR
jgi:hypothetical protein